MAMGCRPGGGAKGLMGCDLGTLTSGAHKRRWPTATQMHCPLSQLLTGRQAAYRAKSH